MRYNPQNIEKYTSPTSTSHFMNSDIPKNPERVGVSIAAIIPAYNEAAGIQRNLNILTKCSNLQKIIIVNDGSSDLTKETVETFSAQDPRIILINHEKNLGKGQAVFSGFQAAGTEVLVTLDADLIGMTCQHVDDLISPVIRGQADMSIGIFKGGKINTDFAHWATPWLSGQRCIPTELLRKISWKAAEGYGLESAITIAGHQQAWHCIKVPWKGVTHPPSEFHRGIRQGILTRIRMYYQILRSCCLALNADKIVRQFQIHF